MSFYKLEATYKTVPTAANLAGGRKTQSKTYKYFLSSYESMSLRLRNELLNKATVKVKSISEQEYIKGIQ